MAIRLLVPRRALRHSETERGSEGNPDFMVPPEVHQVAARFGVAILSAEPVGGGFSGATVYRAITEDGRDLAVRRTPLPDALALERQISLARLLAGVRQLGVTTVPVPLAPVSDRADALSRHRYCLEDEHARWQMEPWMPGHALSGEDISPVRLRAALTSLKEFHSAARTVVLRGSLEPWFTVRCAPSPAVLSRLQQVRNLDAGELAKLERQAQAEQETRIRTAAISVCLAVRRWLPWLESSLSRLSTERVSLQPVLRDVWQAHVLFSNDAVTGLIDPVAAATEHPAADLSRLLRSWFRADFRRMQDALTLALQLQVLREQDLPLFHALDASGLLLSPITWLRRRNDPCLSDRWTPEITNRLERLAAVAARWAPGPQGAISL